MWAAEKAAFEVVTFLHLHHGSNYKEREGEREREYRNNKHIYLLRPHEITFHKSSVVL